MGGSAMGVGESRRKLFSATPFRPQQKAAFPMSHCMLGQECLHAAQARPHWAPGQQRVSSRRPSRPALARRRAVRVSAGDTAFGPEPPPEWLKCAAVCAQRPTPPPRKRLTLSFPRRKLQEAAEDDDDVAELLKDTGGDPRAVEARVRLVYDGWPRATTDSAFGVASDSGTLHTAAGRHHAHAHRCALLRG